MSNNLLETLIGAVVIAIAAAFFMFAFSNADFGGGGDSYTLKAKFNNVTGISSGTDVRLSGIKVGTVTGTELDKVTYQAVVSMQIEQGVELADDTSLRVSSDGLLGGSFLALEPGGGMDILGDGDEITYTQSSIDLIGLIGQMVFSGGGDGGDAAAAADGGESTETPAMP